MERTAPRVMNLLTHIGLAIERITGYTAGMAEADFKASQSTMTRDAVVRNLNVIGQAVEDLRSIDPAFGSLDAGLPLHFAWELRKVFPAGEPDIDPSMLWRTVCELLPGLQARVQTLVSALPSDEHQQE